MSEQKPSLNETLASLDQQEQDPFIPPRFMLALAGVGLIVAFFVAITQPTFNVVGFGGLALTAVSLVLWAVLAPGSVKALLSGRGVRFGGVSVLVTLVFLVALAGIYTVVRGQSIRLDLTERSDFSLTEESRAAITALGADPTLPEVRILAFYNAAQAGQRDRDQALFEDYETASNGRITYEFTDPDRNPAQASEYNITRAGQIAVVALGEDGLPVVADAELVNSAAQEGLTNAILSAAAQGDFQAYFLQVDGNLSAEMSQIRGVLTERYGWTVRDVTFVDLASPQSDITLNDPNADAQLMILVGGSRPLAEPELAILQGFVAGGGDVIVMAGNNFNDDRQSLATAENFNAFLETTYGLRINSDVVMDLRDAFQSPVIPVASTFDPTSPITTIGIQRNQGVMIFEAPHSISLSATPPADVALVSLIQSGVESFATTDLQRVLDGNLDRLETDAPGPFTLAASAENTVTGSRLVVFGSATVGSDSFTALGTDNLSVAFNSIVWATDFVDFVDTVTVTQEQLPQDTPIFADASQLRTIQLITIYLLPFGILALGVLVWWGNRERARE